MLELVDQILQTIEERTSQSLDNQAKLLRQTEKLRKEIEGYKSFELQSWQRKPSHAWRSAPTRMRMFLQWGVR